MHWDTIQLQSVSVANARKHAGNVAAYRWFQTYTCLGDDRGKQMGRRSVQRVVS